MIIWVSKLTTWHVWRFCLFSLLCFFILVILAFSHMILNNWFSVINLLVFSSSLKRFSFYLERIIVAVVVLGLTWPLLRHLHLDIVLLIEKSAGFRFSSGFNESFVFISLFQFALSWHFSIILNNSSTFLSLLLFFQKSFHRFLHLINLFPLLGQSIIWNLNLFIKTLAEFSIFFAYLCKIIKLLRVWKLSLTIVRF